MRKIKRIWYEGRYRKVDEIEFDHIHLDDGTVIRNNEIKLTPLGYKSSWSEKKQTKELFKKYKELETIYIRLGFKFPVVDNILEFFRRKFNEKN